MRRYLSAMLAVMLGLKLNPFINSWNKQCMSANSKRIHTPYNSSVYASINKCSFIPNTAFEVISHIDYLDNGQCIRMYTSDNKQYSRIVLFNDKQTKEGICGILINNKTHEIIYCSTTPEHQNQGIYKQLRAYAVLLGFKLWSVHHSDLMRSKLAC